MTASVMIPNPPVRVSPLATAILADLPEFVELQACRDRQVSATAALRALAAGTNLDLDAEVLARLSEPTDLPADELVEIVGEVLGRKEAITLAKSSLQAAGRSLDYELRALIEDRGDFILERMGARLEELVVRAKALRPLAVVSDPAAAIKAGRSEDYEKLLAIGKEYRDLRTEQFKILQRDLENGTSGPLASIKNMEAAFPLYDVWSGPAGGVLRERGSRATRPVNPPWPIASGQRFNLAVAEPRFLLWAIEAGVTLWIPTRQQLSREAKRLQDHFHALRSNARPPRPGEWTDSFGRLVGAREDSPAEPTGLTPFSL